MSWSLDYQPAKEATRLEHFFSVSGRALYLASSFELKCREILRIVKLHHHYDETNDWSASMALSRALRGKMLSEIIKQLKLLTEIQESDISTLEKAKTARNFIAHELGALSPISSIFASSIEERLDTLSEHLPDLAAGGNLISVWLYEYSEKEPAPYGIQKEYAGWVQRWVFSGKHT